MRRCRAVVLPIILGLVLSSCGAGSALPPSVSPTASSLPGPSETETPSPSATPLPTATRVSLDEPVHGVAYSAATEGYLSHQGSDWTLSEVIRPIGVNWLRLDISTNCFQQDFQATEIACLPDKSMPTEADLRHVTEVAHGLGMKVLLEVDFTFADDPFHALGDIGFTFNEAEWQAWFASYTAFVSIFAEKAQAVGVDMFSIGQELESASHRDAEWRAVVDEVRELYVGPILYSSGAEESWLGITWWDAVDAIGVRPQHVALSETSTPTVEQLEASWAPVVERLGELSENWDRPVIVTALGYPTIDGISTEPWNADHIGQVDLQEQADLVEAAFGAFSGHEWFLGFFWEGWHALETLAGPHNADASPNNKPAEDVLRAQYGMPPRPVSPQPPELDTTRGFDVYRDGLHGPWEYALFGEGSLVDMAYGPISIAELSIRVSLGAGGELVLLNKEHADLSAYEWLEFYVYFTQALTWGEDAAAASYRPVRLSVSLRDEYGFPRPLRVQFSHSQYLREGELLLNRWQRVRIPLAAFGPSSEAIHAIVIQNDSGFEIPTFYLDSIRFWAGIPSSP